MGDQKSKSNVGESEGVMAHQMGLDLKNVGLLSPKPKFWR